MAAQWCVHTLHCKHHNNYLVLQDTMLAYIHSPVITNMSGSFFNAIVANESVDEEALSRQLPKSLVSLKFKVGSPKFSFKIENFLRHVLV